MSQEQNQAIREAFKILSDDGGLRRTLRRIEPTENEQALFHQGTHDVLRRLAEAGMKDRTRALDAALLLAHVDRHEPGRLGQQFKAIVQPARFRRIADAKRPEALESIRHMVQQCKHRVDVVGLAWTAYRWGQPRREGSTTPTARERLALDYYSPKKILEDSQ